MREIDNIPALKCALERKVREINKLPALKRAQELWRLYLGVSQGVYTKAEKALAKEQSDRVKAKMEGA